VNKLFVCGDLHGRSLDMQKLNTTKWKEQKELSKDDVLIQLGDFGLVWYNDSDRRAREEINFRKWLVNKKFTTAFLDGNHENHELLEQLPEDKKWGGNVGVLKVNNDKIYYLKRGEIYTINDKKILIIGGAETQEKGEEGKNWWKQELLSNNDKTNILNNLKLHNFEVDYVLSHTCPKSIGTELASLKFGGGWSYSNSLFERYFFKMNDPVAHFLEFLLQEGLKTKEWHFGHWHHDFKYVNDDKIKFFCHYNAIPYELK